MLMLHETKDVSVSFVWMDTSQSYNYMRGF
jgi:hypothetical protein